MSAPAARPASQARRMRAALPERSPITGLIWASQRRKARGPRAGSVMGRLYRGPRRGGRSRHGGGRERRSPPPPCRSTTTPLPPVRARLRGGTASPSFGARGTDRGCMRMTGKLAIGTALVLAALSPSVRPGLRRSSPSSTRAVASTRVRSRAAYSTAPGTYRLPSGYEYSGEWVEGEIRGEGRARFPDGSVYEGEFVAGKPEGQGTITFADGGSYTGAWVDGRIEGEGVAEYADGRPLRGHVQGRSPRRAGDDRGADRLSLRGGLGRRRARGAGHDHLSRRLDL